MKKKYFLAILILMMTIFLIGCSITTPEINQEMEINITVTKYWLALSDRQYELAKTYCIPYGEAYYAVEEYQSLFDYDYLTLNWTPYIKWVKIIGNKATVNMDITLVVTVCFENICSSESETFYDCFIGLTKNIGAWKLT